MNLRNEYDWIVFGNHPGALLSAGLASRLGLSVLILPFAPYLGFSTSRLGQPFDPETNQIIGLGNSPTHLGLISGCLAKLGMTAEEKNCIQIRARPHQVLTPQTRLSLTSCEDLEYEFFRELGESTAQKLGLAQVLKSVESEHLSYWQRLPDRLTLSPYRRIHSGQASESPVRMPIDMKELRRKLSQKLNESRSSVLSWCSTTTKISEIATLLGRPDLPEIFAGLYYGVTSYANPNPILADIIHILSLARTEGSFRGGLTSYREFLIGIAKRLGADVFTAGGCKQLLVERGRFVGASLSTQATPVLSRNGILGCTAERAFSKTAFQGRKFFDPKKKITRKSGWRFTLALTVKKEAFPLGMSPHLVWQEKSAPILEADLIEPEEYGLKDDDTRILYLRTLMPFSEQSLEVEFQRQMAGKMVRKMMEILPFLENHVTRIYPEFRSSSAKTSLSHPAPPSQVDSSDASAYSELKELYGFESLERVPDNLITFEDPGLGFETGIEGLFIASQESYPSLGSLGPTVAALEAISVVAHQAGLQGPFT